MVDGAVHVVSKSTLFLLEPVIFRIRLKKGGLLHRGLRDQF